MRSFLSSESLCSTGNSQKNTQCSEHTAIHVTHEIMKGMLCQNLLTAPVQLMTSDQWLSVYVHYVDYVHIAPQKVRLLDLLLLSSQTAKNT